MMTSSQAIEIAESLSAAGIRAWLMGGWGVDALLGEQTRQHHDLDLLVDAADLPALDGWLTEHGFARAYEWDENAPVFLDEQHWDTAFVARHDDGRELDIHAVYNERGLVRLATTDPWHLPSRPLDGMGTIDGRPVACVTVEAQRAMHHGYVLPDHHREDLRRLGGL